MRRNLSAGYHSGSMCDAVGVSERVLQLAFREAVGMSPSRWFTCARLNAARRLLLSGDSPPITVTGAASRCGFEHLGRFSTEYRVLFGEKPSETLTRRRGVSRGKAVVLSSAQ
jgi:AraC family ethanolamine operon transcriptional activator